MENIFTVAEVATRYKVKETTVREWIKQKRLSAVLIGKEYRIRETDLSAFEKKNETI